MQRYDRSHAHKVDYTGWYPRSQTQLAPALLPAGEMVPAVGHATQAAADVATGVAEYVPARHATQAAADVAAGVAEYVPARHATQAAADVTAAVDKYVPAEQAVHAAEPLAVL
jgi:hypothetical protein